MNVTVMLATMLLSTARLEPDPTCLLGRVDRSETPAAACLSCHDGSTARAIQLRGNTWGCHPVSVPYLSPRSELALRPFGPESPLVVLPAGRVECTTCHLAEGVGPHRTVLTIGLCSSCHQK